MDTNNTETSFLTSEVSLTRIHAESDLPGNHESRRTKNRLPSRWSIITRLIFLHHHVSDHETHGSYLHGEGITRKRDGEQLWLCRLCYEKKPLRSSYSRRLQLPIRAIRHLVKHHGFLDNGEKAPLSKKRRRNSQQDIPAAIQHQLNAQSTIFDRDDWQSYYLAWAVSDDVSLQKDSIETPPTAPIIPQSDIERGYTNV